MTTLPPVPMVTRRSLLRERASTGSSKGQHVWRLVQLAVWLAWSPAPGLAHGDLHEQIVRLTAQLSLEPNNAVLRHKRGELHRAHGDYTSALQDYALAEQLDPELTVVHLSRGRALLEMSRHAEARVALDAFLGRESRHVEGLLLRARARARLAERTPVSTQAARLRHEADQDYAAALTHSRDPLPDLFLERAENLDAAGEPARALEVLAQGMGRLGSLIVLEQAALALERRLARYDAALQRIDRLLAQAERKESWLSVRAEVLDSAGRPQEAAWARAGALTLIAALPAGKRALASTRELERRLQAQPH
jgi:hypothetical protein